VLCRFLRLVNRRVALLRMPGRQLLQCCRGCLLLDLRPWHGVDLPNCYCVYRLQGRHLRGLRRLQRVHCLPCRHPLDQRRRSNGGHMRPLPCWGVFRCPRLISLHPLCCRHVYQRRWNSHVRRVLCWLLFLRQWSSNQRRLCCVCSWIVLGRKWGQCVLALPGRHIFGHSQGGGLHRLRCGPVFTKPRNRLHCVPCWRLHVRQRGQCLQPVLPGGLRCCRRLDGL
jgi:hypothetical protein